ncbi:LCP family protein [Streptomyces meridianus]|uniref:LCP family protein n=1 Tax=Streptomyces meridianus TaxID=2938945 RepID=A0ABT0X6M3_9ACTN|nr:LCP family protein [Streptomyces meridianus]MCM2578173.1 LCP family protein [Streptomyces meridianus]
MADDPGTDNTTGRPDGRIRGAGRWHKRAPARHRSLVISAWVAAALLVTGGSGFGYLWFKLNGNLKGINLDAALGHDRPRDVANGSMDILVLGSDTRAGDNRIYGRATGARSDTAMILHIYRGHRKASLVSIPRDTIVDRPACARTEGGTAPAAERTMFNESYRIGGPACTVKTVEALSGIRMDHYVEVDFTGFKKLIDRLGGVEIETKEPIRDRDSHLHLEPGRHNLRGEQALGLVRTRHAVGDGSDLGRIQLQQAFVKALIKRVEDIDLFGNPAELYSLADTATRSVTTDSDLASVQDLVGLVRSLKSIKSADIDTVTMPVVYDPDDSNRVVPLEKRADQLWKALRDDRPVPESATEGSDAGKADVSDVVGERSPGAPE